MSRFQNRYFQFFILLVLGMIWGSSFILMKKALRTWEADELAALRIVLAGLFLLPLLSKQFKLVRKKDVVPLILAGLFGNAIPAFLFAFAQTHIESALGGMINSTTPIFTLLFGLLIFRIRISGLALVGIAVGLGGAIYLIYTYGTSLHGDWRYALLAVAASACYGMALNLIKSKLDHLPSLVIAGFPFAITSPLALIYLLGIGTFTRVPETPGMLNDAIYIIILALMATAIGVYLFNFLIKATSALFASLTTYLIPAFAFLWGISDGEEIGLPYIIGFTLIISAVWLVNKGQTKNNAIDK